MKNYKLNKIFQFLFPFLFIVGIALLFLKLNNKETLYLVEEKRDYKMPIIEDEYGTSIYTDYIFEMFSEISDLQPYLKRGIVDTLFIEDDSRIYQVCRDYHRITSQNKEFLKESLYHNYPDVYSSGYLYQKTNISKE